MASGIRDFSLVLSSRIAGLFLGLGIQSCLAWVLGPAERGAYAVCLMFSTLLSIFCVVGCDIASVYFVSSKKFSISEGIIYTLIYIGIGSALAIVIGLILMQLPLPFLNKATPTAFYVALFTIPTSLFSLVFLRLLTAVHQFTVYAIMLLVNGFIYLLLTVLFVWGLSWGIIGAFLASLIVGVITIISTLVFFRWRYDVTWVRPSVKNLLDMLHYGARYYVGKISNEMNFQVGTIILALFATKEEIGLFAVASQLMARTMIIPDTLTEVLIPKVAGNELGKRELVALCSRLTALICAAILLVLVVFAKPVVIVLFSPAFLSIVPLVRILAIGIFVRGTCKVFVSYLLGTNHPGVASISTAIGVVVNLIVLWLLLPAIGLLGAAIAMVSGYFAGSALLTLYFIRFSGLGLKQIWWLRYDDFVMLGDTVKRAYQKILP